jgi:hypothetical protein
MKPKVVITVSGGVAELASVTPPDSVEVEIIDYDNLEAEGEDNPDQQYADQVEFQYPIPHRSYD